ncbi:SpoIIE family protein phosphatase [Streptomyces sp. SBT349]|uniref:SpoIIE family protein phosphatase n=1 Tax=Streptomyces sp. SBT349 TaxID=1580539 RepID=UPI00099E030C|nr:SpoIIE family protein phosphatase [Streptomyces sp. SBT349]
MAASDPAVHQAGGAEAPVAVIDADGTVTAWSSAAQRLLGLSAAEVVGRSAASLLRTDPVGTDQADRPAAGLSRILRDGTGWSGTVEARHRDGHGVPVRARLFPLVTPDGNAPWLLTATPPAWRPESDATAEPLLTALKYRSPMGISIYDTDLRLRWMNETVARQTGRSEEGHLGRRLTELSSSVDSRSIEVSLRRVLDEGAQVIDHESRWPSPDGKGTRTFSAAMFRIDAEDGRPLGACVLSVDISRSWARERIRLLGEASTRIGSTLDIVRTAQELADLSVPVIADYITVDLAEAVPLRDEPLQRLDATEVSIPVFRRAGVASIHEDLPESLWAKGEAVYVPPSSPFTKVLATGKSHLEPHLDTSPGTWLDQDPARARVIHETGMHSLMITPLLARGEILGIAVFVRMENPRPFDEDDLVLAEQIALRAALGVDNARQYTRERAAALALQRNLLPRDLSGGRDIEVATRYLPAHVHEGVGGDWFDVIRLDDGRIALVVGDVVGHGLEAAAAMGQLRTAIRTLAYLDLPPAELLTRLDTLVVRLVEGDTSGGCPQPTNATCLYAVHDPATRRCTIARAGHPPPAVVTPDGGVTFPDLPPGTPLGVGLGAFESFELDLAPGTMLALYTDGLVETREADIDSGLGRLRGALSPSDGSLDDLCGRVVDTMVGDRLTEDDIALLLARVRPADRGR